jgi:glutamate-ammonia-ligase adenylyltransferase
MSSHQFFNRLAESFIAEVSRMTSGGSLYRIDLRLRPEGNAGPLTRSVESYENYYAQWGQTWERMMLIKARCVAGSESLGAEFLEMAQNFRYPRLVNENVLREVAAMKARIEKEILGGNERERNVKLGRGGIREIEFVVQTLQLLNAGRQPFLQLSQTLPCLAKLAQYDLLDGKDALRLDAAYRFLRDVEHRLQMDQNLQTHTLPEDSAALKRLARLMGFATVAAFERERQQHSRQVQAVYDGVLRAGRHPAEPEFAAEFEGAESEWKEILRGHSFRDPDAAFLRLREFVEGPGFVHVSRRTSELARELLPKLFGICRKEGGVASKAGKPFLSDPDRVLTRLDAFIQSYGARATLFELWNSQPAAFELLLLLFDRSEFLAETVIRSPELLDDLVVSERLRQRKGTAEILRDLQHGAREADQFAWVRRYHEAERLRIGMRDILGLADFEQNLEELSDLADACLRYAMEVVARESKLATAPFAIVGLGKLGGLEINYGSDLDIVFVTAAQPKELPKLQKLATRVMELLSRRTERGLVCVTDARLRPDGEKGLLVNTLAAYEEYYRQRARLWEIQALTRTRPVAGDFRAGERFQQLAAALTDFSKTAQPASSVAGYSPDWKGKIHEMRLRIEKERTPAGQDELAIKTGRGGLMDAEFVAQTLCLEHGWHEPNTLRALERGRQGGVLPAAEKLIENYKPLRRVEGILRRWSYEGEAVLPDDPAPFYRVAVRCGFDTSVEFRVALAQWRTAVREVYLQFFEQRVTR